MISLAATLPELLQKAKDEFRSESYAESLKTLDELEAESGQSGYRRENLPSGVPYLQVDFELVTKSGYGENVLQREAPALDTLERARTAAHR